MSAAELTESDLTEIAEHGLCAEEVRRQLALCADPPGPAALVRACIVGDGIRRLELPEIDHYLTVYEDALKRRSIVKFVPASGAASRMFKSALAWASSDRPVGLSRLRDAATAGDAAAADLLEALESLERFAFFADLEAAMKAAGLDVREVVAGGDVRDLLAVWLSAEGLDYAALPKGLLAFHRYDDGVRTAFEEHLVEAAHYACGSDRTCRLHLTVSETHRPLFERLLEHVGERYERTYGVRLAVAFSLQKPSTDSIAVAEDGSLFRTGRGDLLFRPGGHGALIENLADLDADLVFIKNIDNVVPDHLKEPTYLWKRVLGGMLVDFQDRSFAHLARIEASPADEDAVVEALAFLEAELNVPAPREIPASDLDGRRAHALAMLDRPVRVCGMVRNEGEPGGGPFWVSARGGESVQIVEGSQVDAASAEQRAIFDSATHFNPVDLVCGLRDRHGRDYDLGEYVDPGTTFVVDKTSEGRRLRALERPGLWNGAMAWWNTVFVEVPPETFNPVKTVNDLLRRAHQPLAAQKNGT